MSWEYPCHRADVTGKQVLTREKPIGHAYGALQELQEKTVLDADIQVRGLAVSQCTVQGNTLVLRGTIANSYGGGDKSLEERVAALEAALSGASLALNLTLADGSLKITGGLTWGGEAGAVENDGAGVEVTDCGE